MRVREFVAVGAVALATLGVVGCSDGASTTAAKTSTITSTASSGPESVVPGDGPSGQPADNSKATSGAASSGAIPPAPTASEGNVDVQKYTETKSDNVMAVSFYSPTRNVVCGFYVSGPPTPGYCGAATSVQGTSPIRCANSNTNTYLNALYPTSVQQGCTNQGISAVDQNTKVLPYGSVLIYRDQVRCRMLQRGVVCYNPLGAGFLLSADENTAFNGSTPTGPQVNGRDYLVNAGTPNAAAAFTTPTGNVTCVSFLSGSAPAACQAKVSVRGTSPTQCSNTDYSQYRSTTTGQQQGCANNPLVSVTTKVLPYGKSIDIYGLVCRSDVAAVTCYSYPGSNTGITMSRDVNNRIGPAYN